MRKPGIGIALLCGALSSCATTSLLTSWVDPEAGGKKLGNVLVVGVAPSVSARRQFEDGFARVLKSRQIGAVTSYVQLPDPAAINEATVKPVALKENVTHFLIVRLVDRRTVTSYVPPTVAYYGPGYYPGYYRTWPGYYSMGYATTMNPGYSYDTVYVNLETNVYDAATGRLVWSGLTETALGSRVQAQIEEFIDVISGAMIRDKLI